ncbi:hypothetical protein AAG906_015118 [Vitis piasezkii]
MMEQGESAMLVTQRKGKKGKSQANQKGKQQISPKSDIKKDEKCFFVKERAREEEMSKFHNWLEKKGNPTSFVCYESNMVNVNTNTWWIDSDLQSTFQIPCGMQNLRKPVTTLDAFKVFKAKVEKQYGKQIKIVRLDRGGEYYGRYLEDGQSPGPFAKFLQEHGIVAQYTMPGSPTKMV